MANPPNSMTDWLRAQLEKHGVSNPDDYINITSAPDMIMGQSNSIFRETRMAIDSASVNVGFGLGVLASLPGVTIARLNDTGDAASKVSYRGRYTDETGVNEFDITVTQRMLGDARGNGRVDPLRVYLQVAALLPMNGNFGLEVDVLKGIMITPDNGKSWTTQDVINIRLKVSGQSEMVVIPALFVGFPDTEVKAKIRALL